MVNLTDTIKEKWQSGGHQIAKIECTGLRYVSTGKLLDTADQTITSDRICDGGLSIDRTSISGSKLELGSAIAATLSLTLYNTDKKYDDVNFEGVEMKVSVAVDEDSGFRSVCSSSIRRRVICPPFPSQQWTEWYCLTKTQADLTTIPTQP